MSKRLSSPLRQPLAAGVFSVAVLGLSACGGGGSSTDSSASSAGGATAPTPDAVLSGVAATGAPLGGAFISVLDAKGKTLGSGTTRLADGAYSITLNTKTPTGPLMVQARGVDVAGNPQVLHSAVPTVAAAMVANVTPLSQAVVALALGAEPGPVFNAASTNSAPLANLAQAKAAGEFLKTLIKSQISDVKATAATLDLLGDAAFSADKKPHDLLVEGVRVTLAKGSKGEPVLQLANKLQVSLAPEVSVDLGLAKAEFAKTTGAAPATAITSTLKATASYAAVMSVLGPLDELGAALNKLIAQGASAETMEGSPLLTNYVRNDGRSVIDLADTLAGYAANNWQLGRFQLVGCADDVQAKGTCAKVQVAALVTDSTGTVKDLFTNVVSYSKTPAAGVPAWGLVGNGKAVDFQVRALSWLGLQADGSPSTGAAGSPSSGVQLALMGQDREGNKLLDSATVQTPGGFSIALAACGQPQPCLAAKAGAITATATGAIADTLLQPASVGWVGGADTLRNAKYVASYTLDDVASTRSAALPGDLPAAAPAAARFPTLDGVGTGTPLTSAKLSAGLVLGWSTWADANPDLRLTNARVVIRQTDLLTVQDLPVMPGATRLTLPAIAGQADLAVQAHELWITALDASGRLLVTRYTLFQ